jgi:hypothetical protein
MESNGRFSLEQSTREELIDAFRGIEAYEPVTNAAWTVQGRRPGQPRG